MVRLRRYIAPAQRARRPREGHVPAGRVLGYLQRVGHAAADGAGAVQAGDIEGVTRWLTDHRESARHRNLRR